MSRKVPPLHLLESFEAVLRLGSLTHAAEELHLTQGAVSQHIRKLEQFLGVPLFNRDRKQLRPSAAATDYGRKIRILLDEANQASQLLMKDEPLAGELRVSAHSTFTARWLLPRLPDFVATHPNIQLHLLNRDPGHDYGNEVLDWLFSYEYPKDIDSKRIYGLFCERITPICTPEFFDTQITSKGMPQQAGDLQHWPLLHHVSDDSCTDRWLKAAGVENPRRLPGLRFERQTFAIEAAAQSLGLTFAPQQYVEGLLHNGQLVRPFNFSVEEPFSLCLKEPQYRLRNTRAEAFKNWLLIQLKEHAPSHPSKPGRNY